jgi:hypothetical protein
MIFKFKRGDGRYSFVTIGASNGRPRDFLVKVFKVTDILFIQRPIRRGTGPTKAQEHGHAKRPR